MHPCALRVLAGQQLIEADEVIDPKGSSCGWVMGLPAGVSSMPSSRNQPPAVLSSSARSKNHARPPVSLSQKA